METNDPTLRRTKRKLSYLTNKESQSKKWALTVTLGDIDKMFDDLDSDDLCPPSPLLHISDSEINQSERHASPVPHEEHITKKLPTCQMGPEGDVLLPASGSPIPKPHIGKEEDNEKKRVLSPVLFDCETDEKEAKMEPLTIQKPQCNGHVTEEKDYSELESLPSKLTFSKAIMSSDKNKVEGSCKESHPVKEETHKKTQIPVLEEIRKTSSRKLLSPVKDPTPPPPEPEDEDDFLILEEDPPLWLSISSKTAITKRQKQRRTTSTHKDSSMDKDTKDNPIETAHEEEESERGKAKLGIEPVNPKLKKKKGRNNEVTGPGNVKDKLSSPEDVPSGDLVQQEKPNKNKRLKKVPSEDSDEAEEEPNNTANEKTGEEKSSKSTKDGKESAKPNRVKPLKRARKITRQENTDPIVLRVRQEPKLAAPGRHSVRVSTSHPMAEKSTLVGKNMTAFLQKLRDTGQAKPACSRKLLSPVKDPTPPPPEPEDEDDFLILEEDPPLWLSISSKTAITKRQKQRRTTSTHKDSSMDKDTKDNPIETAHEEEESERGKAKLGIEPVNQKLKKKKGRNNEVTGPGNVKDKLSSPEDVPSGDLVQQEKPNKNKRLKKVPSEDSDEAEEEPNNTANEKTGEEKSSKSTKDGKESAKPNMVKPLKRARKVMQASQDIKEMVYDETVKEPSPQQNSKEVINSDAQTTKDLEDKKPKKNKLPVVSEGSSWEESQILGKRKRKKTGEWWLSCHQSTEEPKFTDNRRTPKKKQLKKEPSAAEPTPVKATKDRVLKKNQKQHASLSIKNTKKAKEKKPERNKNSLRDKMKAIEEVFNTTELEHIEDQEQQEVQEQDFDPVQLSHKVFASVLSLNSGDRVFRRVYHHVSNEKKFSTPEPVSARRPLEQLTAAESEKRKRKPPGNWWTLNGMSQDVESTSSQPQQLNSKEPRSRKERKKHFKQSRSPELGTFRNGKMAVSSKLLGGAHVPLLMPLSAPKVVKSSLATLKDIFTSATKTPTVVSSRDTSQKKGRNVSAIPAQDIIVSDCVTLSKTEKDVLSMDDGELRSTQSSPYNHHTPEDSRCQPENMLKVLRSGPSSMIELEPYKENDDLILPSSRIHAVLSVSDLCGYPLKPLILEPEDEANLTKWFKSVWSTTIDNSAEITPDQFDWYFYQGRAIGFLEDLNCGSICNGKILLGSYMKKPLWVDHRATTVFNLLTSSVSLTIDGSETSFSPGQSFIVQWGHAYSIQNITALPAVLYFTRISADSSC